MSDYIKRIRVYNEDGTSEDKQIDYNALANLPDASILLGETEGTAYEGSKGAKNAQKIELLDKVVLQSGLYDILEITQEYAERVTALGENIVDGSTAKLLKVEGNTQTTRNLINPALTTGSVTYAVDGNSIVFTNAKGSASSLYLYSVKKSKGVYTLSVKDIAGESSRRFLSIYKDGVAQQTIATFPAVVTITLNEDATISFRSEVGIGDYNTTTITEVQLVEGEYTEETMPGYTPYFDGFKNASFQGVTSKDADETQESVLSLPEPVECGLGVTIDFENQKIVNSYEEITFNGTEDWSSTVIVGNAGNAYALKGLERYKKIGCVSSPIFTNYVGGGMVASTYQYDYTYFSSNDMKGLLVFSYDGTTTLEEWKAYLAENPMTIRFITLTVQSETPFTDEQKAVGNEYKVWKNGTETVIGERYPENTLAQEYFELLGGVKDETT